ncbi:hypothetical protein [Consotaella aegiceratis]
MRAILNATFRYHHPGLVVIGRPPDEQLAGLDGVVSLLMRGLKRPVE